MEGAQGKEAVGIYDVQPAGFVVHKDREVVVHGPGLAVHLRVQVRADHQVDAGLVQHGHHMHVQPALKEVVGLVRMVDHGHVQQAHFDGRFPERGLSHRLLRPLDLLVQVVLVHVLATVQDRPALPGLACVKDDEGDRALAESIVERRWIGVRIDVREQFHVIAAPLVVAASEQERNPGGKTSQRLNGITDQGVQHVVPRRSDIAVQEQEIGRCGIHLRGERLVPVRPHVDVVKHGEPALGSLRIEGPDGVPLSFVEASELGIPRIGVIHELLPADAVAKHLPRPEPVDTDAVQAVEDAPAGIGFPNLGSIGQFDIGHPGHVAGPENGDPVGPGLGHPRAGHDAAGEAVQAERDAHKEEKKLFHCMMVWASFSMLRLRAEASTMSLYTPPLR